MMSGIGLQMPFGEDGRELSVMGLKMPSKVDTDFIRGLFMGDSCSFYLRGTLLGNMGLCCSPA